VSLLPRLQDLETMSIIGCTDGLRNITDTENVWKEIVVGITGDLLNHQKGIHQVPCSMMVAQFVVLHLLLVMTTRNTIIIEVTGDEGKYFVLKKKLKSFKSVNRMDSIFSL